jgi:tripartite-type tricarboxylate transporter receptor subunit TctC
VKIASTFLGAAMVALTAAAPALAEYPERAVTLLIPFSPGGGSDVSARTYEPYLEECLGQDVVIVNKPGAGGELGFAELAQTTPDGYTIGYLNMPNMATGAITKDAPWTIDSFAYVGNVIGSRVTLSVPIESEIQDLDGLVAFAKENSPVALSVSGIGGDDHLMALRFSKLAGFDFNVIPFGDGASSRAALMGGHVQVGSMSNSEAALYQDRFRTLGVMDSERSSFLPDIPTFQEQGYDIVGGSTQVIGAPAGTPDEVIQKWSDCLGQVVNDPAFLEDATTRALPLAYMTAEETEQFVRAENEQLKALWESDPWIE